MQLMRTNRALSLSKSATAIMPKSDKLYINSFLKKGKFMIDVDVLDDEAKKQALTEIWGVDGVSYNVSHNKRVLMDNLVKACFEFCGWNSGLLTDAIFRDG
jgi:hypothetical protein